VAFASPAKSSVRWLLISLLTGGLASLLLSPMTPSGRAWVDYQTQTTEQLQALHDIDVSDRAVTEHRAQRQRDSQALWKAHVRIQLILFVSVSLAMIALPQIQSARQPGRGLRSIFRPSRRSTTITKDQ